MLNTGAVICHPEWPVPLVTRFQACIRLLEVPIPITKGQQVPQSDKNLHTMLPPIAPA